MSLKFYKRFNQTESRQGLQSKAVEAGPVQRREDEKTRLASTEKMFRFEKTEHKIKEREDTWMCFSGGTVGWSSYNQGWFKSRVVSSRKQGQKVIPLGMAKTLGFISQVRRMRIDLRSTSPSFSFAGEVYPLLLAILIALGPAAVASASNVDPRLMQAARMYEEYFLSQMVRGMRATVSKSGLINESMGESIYSEQLDAQYVQAWSERGGVGLAQMIHDHVAAQQAQMLTKRDRVSRQNNGSKDWQKFTAERAVQGGSSNPRAGAK